MEAWKLKMETALDELENVWLKDRPYVTGDKITIADLIALCEVDEPRKFKKKDCRKFFFKTCFKQVIFKLTILFNFFHFRCCGIRRITRQAERCRMVKSG